MNRRQIVFPARCWQVAVALWLGCLLAGPARGQAAQPLRPVLARLVRPTPGTRPLGEVLAELSRQGSLPVSYSSSLIPVNRSCYLRPGPARPIGTVLREVLAAVHLSYGLLEGQLVLWPDQVAAPTGVVAVNGRASLPVVATQLPALSEAVGRSKTKVVTKPFATRSSHPPSRPELLSSAAKLIPTSIKPEKAAADRKTLDDGSRTSAAPPSYAARFRARSSSRQRRKTQDDSPATSAGNFVPEPLGQTNHTLATASPGSRQSHTRPNAYGRRPAREVAASSFSAPAYPVQRPFSRSPQARGPLASLLPLAVVPKSAFAAEGAQILPPVLAASSHAVGHNALPANKSSADSAAQKSNTLARLLRRGYLHGEAWGSESLPLHAAVKLGMPRIYLVLGVATGPFDRQPAGAWGVGVGTVGQPRGRFTPSLDLLHWFVGGRQDEAPRDQQLTQLRPTLAWQIKQGSRWQLIGGPTLNLAAAHRDGQRTRWNLGQDQWLWLDSGEGPNLRRFWPGFQLGVRF